MLNLKLGKTAGSKSPGLRRFFGLTVIFILLWAANGWAQTKPAVSPTPPAAPAQEKILSDLNQALQQQLEEFTEQLTKIQGEYKKTQEEAQSLGVAISTHKAALSLDKITLDQAKELQQYYARLAAEKAKVAATVTSEMEKYDKIQSELMDATKKSPGEKEHPSPTPLKTAAQRALAQKNQQYLKLASATIGKLEELQKVNQSRLEVLRQEQASLEEFSQALQKFAEEKFKSQLLERQKPTDILTLTKELFAASLTLPQRFYDWLADTIQSGAASELIKAHRSKLIGLLLFLGILLYAMNLLQRATRDFRRTLEAGAVTFSLKLCMALTNSLAGIYYLLAITVWLALSLWVTGVLDHPAAQMFLGGVAAVTLIRLLRRLLTALFAPGQSGQGIINLEAATARYYSRYGFMTLLSFVAGYYFLWSIKLLGYQNSGFTFAVLIYLIIMLFLFSRLLRKPYLENLLTGAGMRQHSWLAGIIQSVRLLVLLGLCVIIIIDLLGFQNLALYLAESAFLTALLIAGGWLVKQMGKDLNRFLTSPEGFLSRTFALRAESLEGIHLFLSQTFNLAIFLLTLAGIFLTWGIDFSVLRKIVAELAQGPSLGPVTLSPLAILLAGLSIWLAGRLSRFTRVLLETRIFQRRKWDIGIRHTIANTVHYTFMTCGIILALGFLGINYANLAIVAGGLGVGIGFGLQNIVNNFFSGLILLFERPIKVGDLLVIDGQWGTVRDIRVRSTVFETVERAVLIIPNSDLISNKILNWTFNGRGPNRLTLKVGVAYDSDVHQVTSIINQICTENHRVLKEPPPQVYFNAYGDSSLDFTVWVFVRTPADRNPATHELNAAIFDAFNRHGIEFPYPQMDLHIRSVTPKLQALPVPPPSEDG
jgi:potassium-dependent mechanosensitive channel